MNNLPKSTLFIPEGLQQVLLHACCAPCSSAIVEWLVAHGIRPVIFYFNPNIYPREEYEIRKNESQRHADSLGIRWIDGDYDHDRWLQNIKGLEQEPERGKRCEMCFRYRLLQTAKTAQREHITWFATTLASSRWKNLDQINSAGLWAEQQVNNQAQSLSADSPTMTPSATLASSKPTDNPSVLQSGKTEFSDVCFWAQNWRKDGLQQRRNELLKEYSFYNQQYCGCEFSVRN